MMKPMKVKVNFNKQVKDVPNIDTVYKEYALPDDIFTDEDPMSIKLKRIIYTKLSETDRRIILLYASVGSQRKLGKILGVSAATLNHRIADIRNQIKQYL